MAKQILLEADYLRLAAFELPGESVEAGTVALQKGTRAEVRMLGGKARPDVSAWTVLEDGTPLAEVQIEVRVTHAVDAKKQALVVSSEITMLEIDLSTVSDDAVQDKHEFSRLVLDEPSNRLWVNLRSASLVSALSQREVIEVDVVAVRDHVTPYKNGKGHWLNSRQAIRSVVAGRDLWLTEIELESFVGDPKAYRDSDGKVVAHSSYGTPGMPVDSRGTRLPYEVGLYVRGGSRNSYKETLKPIAWRMPDRSEQSDLFE